MAVLAGGRLLLLDPGEPVDLLEPLVHLEHLGEATSHAGHLGHLLSVRVSRLLRDGECRPSFYAAWQGVRFHFSSIWDFQFCGMPNHPLKVNNRFALGKQGKFV